jgi:hypothetical protein
MIDQFLILYNVRGQVECSVAQVAVGEVLKSYCRKPCDAGGHFEAIFAWNNELAGEDAGGSVGFQSGGFSGFELIRFAVAESGERGGRVAHV